MVLCSFMQRQFSTQEQAFAQQVEKFLREFTGLPGAALWRTPAWQEGLLERGWSVPGWPQRLGGPGWSAAQRYLWYRACHAILDDFCEPPGIAVVGPVVARLGTGVQQQRWLLDIAQFDATWSLALTGAQELPVVKEGRLSGSYVRMTQADSADHLLCLASPSPAELMLLVLEPAAATKTETYALLSGELVCDLSFEDVSIDPDAVLAREFINGTPQRLLDDWFGEHLPALGRQHLDVQLLDSELLFDDQAGAGRPAKVPAPVVAASVSASTAALEAGLEMIAEQLQTLPDEVELEQRLQSLRIETAALTALGLRCLDAETRGLPVPVSGLLLGQRQSRIEAKIGGLLVDTFGYYAVPFVDPALSHNEPPIGPEGADGLGARGLIQRFLRASLEGWGQDRE